MSAFLDWFNANTAVVGAVSALAGYWFGFRSNIWLERRREWNAVVDRVRAKLIGRTQAPLRSQIIDDADADLLIAKAGFFKRRKIVTSLGELDAIRRQHQKNSWDETTYTSEQEAQAERIRVALLKIITHR